MAAPLRESHAHLIQEHLAKGAAFNYAGSLTTPTCDEIVDWWVVQDPAVVSVAEFAAFREQLKKSNATADGHNERPVQPLNGRTVAQF